MAQETHKCLITRKSFHEGTVTIRLKQFDENPTNPREYYNNGQYLGEFSVNPGVDLNNLNYFEALIDFEARLLISATPIRDAQ